EAMAGELILIVEDHDKNRKLVRDVLQVTGYRTAESETAEDGLRLARELRPALILMDLHLPGLNGLEAPAPRRAGRARCRSRRVGPAPAARPARPGRGDARDERVRGLPPDPGDPGDGAPPGGDGHGPRPVRGAGQGARGGRGRLPDQADQPAGAPRPGALAPPDQGAPRHRPEPGRRTCRAAP